MKILASIILLIILSFQLNAQDNVFVLVDVSKSVRQAELVNAKQLVKDIIQGNPVNTSIFTIRGTLPSFSIITGSKLMIMPLGDRSTVMNYIPTINGVNNNNDINNYVEQYFRTNPTDIRTYLTLAKARCADIAYTNSIREYSMILVSDNVSDDFGGSITGYTYEEQSLVNIFNTITNIYAGTLFSYNTRNAFSVLIQRVNLQGYGGNTDSDGDGVSDLIDKCPNTPKGVTVNPFGCPDTSLKIELTSFKGGTIQNPSPVKENKFTVSWFCKNAPVGAQYKVRLSPINQTGERAQTYTTPSNSYNFQNVGAGKWKITVSPANTNFLASSANTTIEVKIHNSMWLLWLFLIAGIFGGGYWFWNKKREEKLRRLSSQSKDDGFSTGSTINTNSDNSAYF